MPLLLCLIVFVVWLTYKRKKVSRKENNNADTFWDREHQANLTRKKDISNLPYITIPYQQLPFREETDIEIKQVQKQIKKLDGQLILNLTGYSNTDLKFEYGAPNFNKLSIADANYTILVRTLNRWGTLLHENGFDDDALCVLNFALVCKTEISATYLLLANIYAGRGQKENIQKLIQAAKSISSMTKDALLLSLQEYEN